MTAVQELADQIQSAVTRLPVDGRAQWGGLTLAHELDVDERHIGIVEVPADKAAPQVQPKIVGAIEKAIPSIDFDRYGRTFIGTWYLDAILEPYSDSYAEDRGALQPTR